MLKPPALPDKVFLRGVVTLLVLGFALLATSSPAEAQQTRDFRPIAQGEVYERQFLDDFYNTLGYRPQGLTWIEESETVRLLVSGGMHAERGDYEQALTSFGIIPDSIEAAFPFLTTMHEDLLVPRILEPWYDIEDAREMLFAFYEDAWLPHPEYRDDYLTFRDDTMGRASRRDPSVPAVWILGHLADFGFVPDQALTEDDPYLFLWDLLIAVTYYSQRATYYGLQWDRYNEGDYNRAVVRRIGEIIRAAHDEAASQEMGRGFWADLIQSHHPFEAPTPGIETSGEISPATDTRPTSQPGPSEPTVSTVGETNYSSLFTPPSEVDTDEKLAQIEGLIDDLAERVRPPDVMEIPEEVPSDVDQVWPDVDTPGTVEEPPTETGIIHEDIPDEFMAGAVPDRTPSESAPEEQPPAELGNYAVVRLGEIADQLALDIGVLAGELGRETIDLVVLYNDMNVSEETIVNAEDRYIAKREAFLAGLAIWDRFSMEVYTHLTLADFDDLVTADLRAPLQELRASSAQWNQYRAFEAHFEEAFGQIENGVRNRRDEPDVLAAEQAALTAFLGEYNDLIKDIEDLLSGAVTEPPEEEEIVE